MTNHKEKFNEGEMNKNEIEFWTKPLTAQDIRNYVERSEFKCYNLAVPTEEQALTVIEGDDAVKFLCKSYKIEYEQAVK